MKTFILIVIALFVLLLIAYVVISALVFIFQEINHSVKKIKRLVRQAWWDLEWKFKYH